MKPSQTLTTISKQLFKSEPEWHSRPHLDPFQPLHDHLPPLSFPQFLSHFGNVAAGDSVPAIGASNLRVPANTTSSPMGLSLRTRSPLSKDTTALTSYSSGAVSILPSSPHFSVLLSLKQPNPKILLITDTLFGELFTEII